MKWVKDKTGRFPQRPHYLPEEIDDECERVVRDFLSKKDRWTKPAQLFPGASVHASEPL